MNLELLLEAMISWICDNLSPTDVFSDETLRKSAREVLSHELDRIPGYVEEIERLEGLESELRDCISELSYKVDDITREKEQLQYALDDIRREKESLGVDLDDKEREIYRLQSRIRDLQYGHRYL
jgi:chromosome segregation ATPase